ncbi:MAG: extracellular solute-binding protein, partial [Pirellulaceae bacterium]|nr:extracellular solute-binding protein [Pirellulaceae bacterium]
VPLASAGCWSADGPQVVVYCALDREFSEPILDEFEKQTGITVLPVYDVESNKTVGLAERIIQERKRPRCDVFWNNEILHTLRLQEKGLLDKYVSPSAKDFPTNYKCPDGHWHGFAARARVFIINTEVLPDEANWPGSIHDLVDEKWKNKVAVAKPMFGTTASHAAILFTHLGDRKATEFFEKLKANAAIVSGNKQVAQDVAARRYAFGITDTDDAIIEKDKGAKVAIVYPDQGEDEIGTPFIPNTLGIIKGSPNSSAARKLVDYLLKSEIEERLAKGESAQFPVNPRVKIEPRVKPNDTSLKWMNVDFGEASKHWDAARDTVKKVLN